MFLPKVKTINTPIIRQLLIFHLVPDVCSAIQQKALIHESSMLTPLCCKLSQARAVRTTGSRAGNGLKWEDQRRRRRRSKMRRVEMGTNQMEIGGGRAQRALWQATSVPIQFRWMRVHVTTVVLLLRGMSHEHTIYLSMACSCAQLCISHCPFGTCSNHLNLNGLSSVIVIPIPIALCNLQARQSFLPLFRELLGLTWRRATYRHWSRHFSCSKTCISSLEHWSFFLALSTNYFLGGLQRIERGSKGWKPRERDGRMTREKYLA